jgi:hypothetical protein
MVRFGGRLESGLPKERKKMTMENEARNTFTLVVEGMTLPEETRAKIDSALQRAALAEIAAVDLRGAELTFRPIMAQILSDGGSGGGGEGGGGAHIQIRTL